MGDSWWGNTRKYLLGQQKTCGVNQLAGPNLVFIYGTKVKFASTEFSKSAR